MSSLSFPMYLTPLPCLPPSGVSDLCQKSHSPHPFTPCPKSSPFQSFFKVFCLLWETTIIPGPFPAFPLLPYWSRYLSYHTLLTSFYPFQKSLLKPQFLHEVFFLTHPTLIDPYRCGIPSAFILPHNIFSTFHLPPH